MWCHKNFKKVPKDCKYVGHFFALRNSTNEVAKNLANVCATHVERRMNSVSERNLTVAKWVHFAYRIDSVFDVHSMFFLRFKYPLQVFTRGNIFFAFAWQQLLHGVDYAPGRFS